MAALKMKGMGSPPSATALPSSPETSRAQQPSGRTSPLPQLVKMISSSPSSMLIVPMPGPQRLAAALLTWPMASPPSATKMASATALPSSPAYSVAQQTSGTSPSHPRDAQMLSLPSSMLMVHSPGSHRLVAAMSAIGKVPAVLISAP